MKSDIKSIIKKIVIPQLESISPYPAGKPISELERELGIKNIIKMASNENPFGPSPLAIKAINESLQNIFRYPDGNCYELKKKLAEKFNLKMENIIIGNGSNELIELIIRSFVRQGEEVLMADPSFIVYRNVATVVGAMPVSVKLSNFEYDLSGMLSAISKNTKVIVIDNPNNPVGVIVTKNALDSFIEKMPNDIILILDEAYREFVTDRNYPGEIDYLNSGKPVITIRTFSKAYGLAGLRVGYGIAHESLIDYLNRIRQPFNVNYIAQVAAAAALDDNEHLRKTAENNRTGMEFIRESMKKMGLRTIPSQANFLLIELPVDADLIYGEMLKRGIILRSMKGYNLNNFIRVTIGLPEENARFVKEVESVLRDFNIL